MAVESGGPHGHAKGTSSMSGTAKTDRVCVFIPMYNCAPQVTRVIAQLSASRVADQVDGVLCVDNRSNDDTESAAIEALESVPITERVVLRNDDNYGLGGSHKVAIAEAAARGYVSTQRNLLRLCR